MAKSVVLFLIVAVSFWRPLGAEEGTIGKIFEAGNEYYKNQNFTEAIKKYEYLIDSLGVTNYIIWYNLGNSYFRVGHIGLAVAAYEKAHALAPRDPDIINNLEYVRFQTKDKIPVKRPFIIIRWVRELYQSFSFSELVWTAEVLYVLVTAFVCLFLLKRDLYGRLKAVFFILLGIFVVWAGLLATKVYHGRYSRWAVILDPKADIYSGPGEKYTLRFILHEGTKLEVLKENEGWYLIKLENHERGWIQQGSVEVL